MNYEDSLKNLSDIKISNELNSATFKFGAMSFDLLCVILSQIQNEDQEFKAYRLLVSTIEKRIERELNRKSLKSAAEELKVASVQFEEESIKWFEIFEYDSPSGIITFKLNDQLKPYLMNLDSEFTIIKLSSVLSLNGYYAKRLYLLFSRYQNLSKRYNGILKNLHKILDTPESLQKVYNNFKNRVLEKPLEEINLHTELNVVYFEKKVGKTVSSIDFEIKKKPQKQTKNNSKKPPEQEHNSGVIALEEWLSSCKS